MTQMLEGRDIINISPRYWDDPRGANQNFMNVLSKTNRVLFVEPPLQYRYAIKHLQRWSKLLAFRHGLVPVNKNLWVTTCPPALPFKRNIDVFDRANRRLILMWIRKAVKKLGFVKPILWVFTPPSVAYAGQLDEGLLVYHCLDEFASSPAWSHQRNILEQERRLLNKADLVITCSKNLYEAKAPFAKEIINIPNGVDFDHFNSAMDEATPIAPLLNKEKEPIIGFYGSIDFRLDEEFIIQAAKRYPDFQFVLIGRILKKFPALKNLPNVKMLGYVPLPKLPQYLKGFDVCLIPYKLNEFVKNISPLKINEYLAAGKPVVAPDIRAIRDLADMIYIGNSQEEMIDMIPEALQDNSAEAVQNRIETARKNTWQNRVNIASKKIVDLY